ncbi:hypothetical protein [Saccharothrix xinjiangensis]|uniref:Uncharacterized protein n=1 Tax=Saccharothrix xinjiangensis TaxID=204798 RepID=A0ABV9XW24_9PSEU
MTTKKTVVVPGLVVDDELYAAAASGIAEHVPQLHLTWERFTAPRSWWLIPEADGVMSKAELTLAKGADLTVKLNIWYRPDLRGMPHNHPWRRFVGNVLAGGYTENRWVHDADRGRVVDQLGVEHTTGAGNVVDKAVFHEVCEVHDPGRTLSLMVCDAGVRGDWGYLDDSGRYLHHSTQPVEGFEQMLADLNPHQNR